jgi:hypothetical protein
MTDEKLSDIEYFVKKIRENKNNPEQIDLCCRRVLLLLDAYDTVKAVKNV